MAETLKNESEHRGVIAGTSSTGTATLIFQESNQTEYNRLRDLIAGGGLLVIVKGTAENPTEAVYFDISQQRLNHKFEGAETVTTETEQTEQRLDEIRNGGPMHPEAEPEPGPEETGPNGGDPEKLWSSLAASYPNTQQRAGAFSVMAQRSPKSAVPGLGWGPQDVAEFLQTKGLSAKESEHAASLG